MAVAPALAQDVTVNVHLVGLTVSPVEVTIRSGTRAVGGVCTALAAAGFPLVVVSAFQLHDVGQQPTSAAAAAAVNADNMLEVLGVANIAPDTWIVGVHPGESA
jgi:hypothetical protein